jgi:hypothetical protein
VKKIKMPKGGGKLGKAAKVGKIAMSKMGGGRSAMMTTPKMGGGRKKKGMFG